MPTAVSVVVCAYTEDRWDALASGIRSLSRQTRRPLEVIVVIDHQPRLLARAEEHLPRELASVRVVPNAGRRGLSGARNTGVAAARGEIVAFLDDDAVAEPTWLGRLTAPFAAPDVMATGGSCVPAWERDRPCWFPPEFDWVVGCSYVGLPVHAAEIRNPIGAGMAIRRAALARVGGFREDLGRVGRTPLGCEETEIAIRIRRQIGDARILHVPEARVLHAVPRQRATLRYFLRRCHSEGLSKAKVVRTSGSGAGLSSERAYLRRVLPAGVLQALRRGAHGEPAGLRAVTIPAGVAATAVGFVEGVTRLALAGDTA